MGCQLSKQQQQQRHRQYHPKHHLSENLVVQHHHHHSVHDDYNIIKQIGKGSIGMIYLAQSKQPQYTTISSERSGEESSPQHFKNNDTSQKSAGAYNKNNNVMSQYAMKEIDSETLERGAFDSLKKEIALLTTLDHPFIIKFFDSYTITGVEDGKEKLSVVMELCTGGSLDEYVPYSEDTALILVANIVQAILYLHHHNIVHHDLKNENVMFVDKTRDPNNIRLLDFGLAKRFDGVHRILDRNGTIYTLSPEAIRGEYSEKADMWSIGVMCFHLLSGDRPFWGETSHDVGVKVLNMDYSMEGPKWDSISKEAKSFIRGLLQFDPALRYTPFEALHSPWLKQQTEFNVENMSKSERVILEKAKEAHAPMKELQKLSLYAIAHKARSEDVASLRKLYLAIEGEDGEISLPDMQRALKGQLTPEQIKEWFKRSDFEYVRWFSWQSLQSAG